MLELDSFFCYLGGNEKKFSLDYGKKKSNTIISLLLLLVHRIFYSLKMQTL